jgi:hypothetical protein
MTKIAKVVKISVGAVKGYSRHVLRLVLCEPGQRGYKSERGVEVLRESDPFYYSRGGPRSYEGQTREHYEDLAAQINARMALGFSPDTPAVIIEDWFADLAGIA